MSTQDIIVLVAAAVIFGGLGLVALYSNRPDKKDEDVAPGVAAGGAKGKGEGKDSR